MKVAIQIGVIAFLFVVYLALLIRDRVRCCAMIGELEQKVFDLHEQAGELSDGLRLQKARATDAARMLKNREHENFELTRSLADAIKQRDKAMQECRHLEAVIERLTAKS